MPGVSSPLESGRVSFFEACRKAAALAVWIVGGIVFAFILLPLSTFSDMRFAAVIRLGWLRGAAAMLKIRLQVEGTPLDAPVLIVGNHISWLDVIVLGAQLPVTFVAKREVAAWPLLGMLAQCGGTLFVDRRRARVMAVTVEQISQRLSAGGRVVVFPEGTTTTGDSVLPFKAGLFQAAIRADRPVQPVEIRYLRGAAVAAPFVGDDHFIGSLWCLLCLSEVPVRVVWHPPLWDGNRGQLANRARQAILAGRTMDPAAFVATDL